MGLTQYFQFYNQERWLNHWITKRPMKSIKRLSAAVQRLWINLMIRAKHQTPYNKIGTAPFSWCVNRALS